VLGLNYLAQKSRYLVQNLLNFETPSFSVQTLICLDLLLIFWWFLKPKIVFNPPQAKLHCMSPQLFHLTVLNWSVYLFVLCEPSSGPLLTRTHFECWSILFHNVDICVGREGVEKAQNFFSFLNLIISVIWIFNNHRQCVILILTSWFIFFFF